jgi:membrane fusion protein, multidrug efflux system
MHLSPMHPVHRLFFVLLAGITVALPACSSSDAQAPAAGSSQPAVPVTVDRVIEKDMPLDVAVVGTVEAFSTVAVRAQVTGELKDVNFKQGDRA